MSVRYFERTDAANIQKLITSGLLGAQIREVERDEHDWVISFSSGARLRICCEWRIVSNDRISLAGTDDGQQFGLPAPVNGAAKAKELLGDKTIEQISIRPAVADLTIAFGPNTWLEIWNNSSGYEGWLFDAHGFEIVAQGGGQLSIWRPNGESEES